MIQLCHYIYGQKNICKLNPEAINQKIWPSEMAWYWNAFSRRKCNVSIPSSLQVCD